MKRSSFRICTLLGLGLTLAGAPSAPAAGIGLNVTPGKIEIAIRPGAIVNVPVTVRNDSDAAAHIVLATSDFSVDDSGTNHFEPAGSHSNSDATWIAVRPREFDLEPQAFVQVLVSVLAPERELEGEYAGVLFVQTRPVRERGALAFSARFAAKIYASVTGTTHRSGRVERLTASTDSSGAERYRVDFENTGNVHEYLNGRIEIRSSGARPRSFSLAKNVLVERGTRRMLELIGPPLERGPYEVAAIIDYGGDERTGGKVHVDAP